MANINKVKASKSMRFKPHMNTSLGKYYHTKADYLSDMKKGGYEPYSSKEPPSKVKKYEKTQHLTEISRAIRQQTVNGVFKPSGELKRELIKQGTIIKHSQYQEMRKNLPSGQGGFR